MNELDPDLSNPVTNLSNSSEAVPSARDRRRTASGWRAAAARGLAAVLLGQITLAPSSYHR
ncbi:hypothetical protein [Nocardia abscessus]|uniref:hypothetical protein n=1 Tax=Nocardia abscessus TaxID=120957 RepID=UPI00245554CF|nr:hypothetical protein [Nocardia abscessus]